MPVRVVRLVPPTLQRAIGQAIKDFPLMCCDSHRILHLRLDLQCFLVLLARLHRLAAQSQLRNPSKMLIVAGVVAVIPFVHDGFRKSFLVVRIEQAMAHDGLEEMKVTEELGGPIPVRASEIVSNIFFFAVEPFGVVTESSVVTLQLFILYELIQKMSLV